MSIVRADARMTDDAGAFERDVPVSDHRLEPGAESLDLGLEVGDLDHDGDSAMGGEGGSGGSGGSGGIGRATFSAGPFVTTRNVCVPAVGEQEQRCLAALRAAERIEIEGRTPRRSRVYLSRTSFCVSTWPSAVSCAR